MSCSFSKTYCRGTKSQRWCLHKNMHHVTQRRNDGEIYGKLAPTVTPLWNSILLTLIMLKQYLRMRDSQWANSKRRESLWANGSVLRIVVSGRTAVWKSNTDNCRCVYCTATATRTQMSATLRIFKRGVFDTLFHSDYFTHPLSLPRSTFPWKRGIIFEFLPATSLICKKNVRLNWRPHSTGCRPSIRRQ